MGRKKYIKKLVFASLVAAIYAGLTYLSAVFGIAYGGIQFRISEVLTILPIFSPTSIIGLTVGCFLGNIASFNAIDMIFGTLATLLSSVLTYFFRKIKIHGLPLFSILSPVIINAVIIGEELALFYSYSSSPAWLYIAMVGIGEAVVCLLFGIPFYYVIKKYENRLSYLIND